MRISNLKLIGSILFPVLLYVIFCSAHIADPFMDDETWEYYATETLVKSGTPLTVTGIPNTYHPHGYYYMMGMLFGLTGNDEVSARYLGMGATILVFFILGRILYVIRGNMSSLTWLLLGASYLLSPFVIQGSMIITADTGLHHLPLMLWVLYMVERHPYKTVDWFILAIFFFCCLWIKIVTPCMVACACLLFFMFLRRWKYMTSMLLVMLFGGGFFILTWYLYCKGLGLDHTKVISYLFRVAKSRTGFTSINSRIMTLVRSWVVITVWYSLPVVLIVLGIAWKNRKRFTNEPKYNPVLFLLVIGLFVAVVYAFVAGISFGFPRYHFNTFGLVAILVALYGEEALARSRFGPISASSFVIGIVLLYVFFLGDPLYIINFELKLWKLSLPEIPSHTAGWFLFKAVLFCVPAGIALIVALSKRSWALGVYMLFLAAIAVNMSQNFFQVSAEYQTHLSYGEHGTREVIDYCRTNLPDNKTLFATKDISYHVCGRDYVEDYHWGENQYVLERIKNPNTGIIVMGINHHTADQLGKMLQVGTEFAEFLNKHYTQQRIGSYFVWSRKREAGEPAINDNH